MEFRDTPYLASSTPSAAARAAASVVTAADTPFTVAVRLVTEAATAESPDARALASLEIAAALVARPVLTVAVRLVISLARALSAAALADCSERMSASAAVMSVPC